MEDVVKLLVDRLRVVPLSLVDEHILVYNLQKTRSDGVVERVTVSNNSIVHLAHCWKTVHTVVEATSETFLSRVKV